MSTLTWAAVTGLLASVPFGQIIARYRADADLRFVGSGNVGATNCGRLLGPAVGGTVLVLDALKGAVPVALAPWIWDSPHYAGALAILAVLGHCFSPYLGWQGGKGVATSAGVLAVITPWAALSGLVVWGTVVALARKSSLGALLALPVVVAVAWLTAPASLLYVVAIALVVLVRHRSNISRLVAGAELGLSTKE